MNLGEMKEYIGSLVDDKAYSYFTETELVRFLNQAAREVQKKLIQSGNNWYLKIDSSIPTVVGQQEYSVPTDFLKMNRVELVTGISTPSESVITLNNMTLNQQDYFTNLNSTPVGYYLRKDKFALVPRPDSVKTLRLWYTYRITDVSGNTQTIDVPEEFHTYLCHLAAIQCFLKDNRDPSLLLGWTKEVEENLKRDAMERTQDRAVSVVVTDEENFGVPY